MLQLNDFSTLFEIAASLNVAFIAVEYATSYTESVAKNVFKFFDTIKAGINKCKKHIDNETIDSLNDVEINGHSITYKIQKIRREREIISKEVEQLNDSLCASVLEKCQLKCLSMVCLQLFLYCLTAALIGAFEDESISLIETFWVVFSSLSFILLLISFVFGEIKGVGVKFFQSVKWSALSYMIIILISIAITNLIGSSSLPYIEQIWTIFVTATAIYPFVFFLLFILVLKRNSKNINDDINARISELEKKCIDLEDEVEKLSTVNELSVEVEGETVLKTEPRVIQRRIVGRRRVQT